MKYKMWKRHIKNWIQSIEYEMLGRHRKYLNKITDEILEYSDWWDEYFDAG